MESFLKINALRKVYKSRGIETNALNGINMEVNKGEFVSVMGASGAGKTTLLNMLATIDRPTSGDIIFANSHLGSMKSKQLSDFRRKNIGFLFQDYNLLDHLTILDNIAMPLTLANLYHKQILKKVKELAAFFRIENQLNKYPYELSGGQKQRVAMARAVITKPKIVLADEPTGALDSKSAKELLSYLTKLNKEQGVTILMVTHDPFSASYSQRVIMLRDGAVYSEIYKNNDRKEFYGRILNQLAFLGGGLNE